MMELYEALQSGLNIKLLLLALEMPEHELRDKMDYDRFTATEKKRIREVITMWEGGNRNG